MAAESTINMTMERTRDCTASTVNTINTLGFMSTECVAQVHLVD